MGSPARTTSSNAILSVRSDSASFSRARRNAGSSAEASIMPSKVVFACKGRASNPAKSVAVSDAGLPSLQIKMFIANSQLAARDQGINNDDGADQRQRHKRQADLRPGEVLGRNRPNLRANGGAGVHDQRDQNIDV